MKSFIIYNIAFITLWLGALGAVGFPLVSHKYRESLRLKEEREHMTRIFYSRYVEGEDLSHPPMGHDRNEWNKVRDKELKKLEENS